jgi:hypothetical protein
VEAEEEQENLTVVVVEQVVLELHFLVAQKFH